MHTGYMSIASWFVVVMVLPSTLALLGASGAAAQVTEGVPVEESRPAPQRDEGVRAVTLDEAVETASRISPAMEQGRASLRSVEAQRLSSFGRYLPDLSFSYGYSKASTGQLDPTGQAITNQSYSGQLRSSLVVFDGFQRENSLDQARIQVEAEEASLEQREFDVVLQVKTAFYNAVAGAQRVEVERDRVERQEEQLSFVREQVRLGRATRSDTLRSIVDLNNARLALLSAENEARAAEFSLAEAMGVTERVRPSEDEELAVAPLAVDREELVAIAVQQAPSVRTAELSVSAANAGVSSAKSGYWPSLAVGGGWSWRNDVFPPDQRSWSLSLSGSIPIFNRLQRETGVERAEASVTQAVAQRQLAELSVRSDVQSAYDQIETALAGFALAEQSVDAAREDLRVTEQRYRVGMVTTLDLRSAQIALQQAEVDVIRRRFDYQVGIARLESLLGIRLGDLDDSGIADIQDSNANGGTNE